MFVGVLWDEGWKPHWNENLRRVRLVNVFLMAMRKLN
jgi:hypothetical protein